MKKKTKGTLLISLGISSILGGMGSQSCCMSISRTWQDQVAGILPLLMMFFGVILLIWGTVVYNLKPRQTDAR